uniref:Uncharacterized protein n=1 Tax=Oryza brachyantha TaxID=4533 RepID=J3MRY3_ORYBR
LLQFFQTVVPKPHPQFPPLPIKLCSPCSVEIKVPFDSKEFHRNFRGFHSYRNFSIKPFESKE